SREPIRFRTRGHSRIFLFSGFQNDAGIRPRVLGRAIERVRSSPQKVNIDEQDLLGEPSTNSLPGCTTPNILPAHFTRTLDRPLNGLRRLCGIYPAVAGGSRIPSHFSTICKSERALLN